MTSDKELAKFLLHCNSDALYYHTLTKNQQMELKQYCLELIKYGGTTHEMAGGKVFTDNTLLKPARNLVKTLRRKKAEEKSGESGEE